MGMTQDADSEACAPEEFTHFTPDPTGHWTGVFRILQLASTGRYAGIVVLSLDGIERGVLVIMNQPSQEATMARINTRTRQFLGAWELCPRD